MKKEQEQDKKENEAKTAHGTTTVLARLLIMTGSHACALYTAFGQCSLGS